MPTTERPLCGYPINAHYMMKGPIKRCGRPVDVRVFQSHGAGVNPQYTEYCWRHGAWSLGPDVVAIWDHEDDGWKQVGR
jgi:hypothetical protein